MAVFIDGSPNDRESLATAVAFCRALGGRLDVVHPVQSAPVVLPPEATVHVDAAQSVDPRTAAARAAFDAACGGLAFAAWHPIEGTTTDVIRDRGLVHDVVILERVSHEEGPDVQALNTALFEAGAPVLVCPPTPVATVGDWVAVVWSPTVQSSRAVRAALPVLARARSVTILTEAGDRRADPAELAPWLDVHGIASEAATFAGAGLTARGRGRSVLAAAAETGADLLVMGAYGENRLSALMGLGRATQKVVTATRIPALVHA